MASKLSDEIIWPVAVVTKGDASAATQLFRLDRQLYLTILVKAAFKLVPNGMMTRMPAPPIVTQDVFQGRPGAQSLIVASDIVPTRARTDVWLTGQAHAPGQRPAATSTASITIYRRRSMVLHKSISIRGDVDSSGQTTPFTSMPLQYERAMRTEENPVGVDPQRGAPNLILPQDPQRAAGFGPISTYWPGRRRYLGALEPRQADYDFPELPREFDVRYFQAAPPDQQVPYLAGDESIVLEGLHPEIERLTTYLPQVRANVSLFSKTNPQTPQDVPLCLDTLSIHAQFQAAYVVFRAYLPIRENMVAVLRALASIETAEKPGSAVRKPLARSSRRHRPLAATTPPRPPQPPPTPLSPPPPAPSEVKSAPPDKPSKKAQKQTFIGTITPDLPIVPFVQEKQEANSVARVVPKVEIAEKEWSGQTFVGTLTPDAMPLPFVQAATQAPAKAPEVKKPQEDFGNRTFVGTLQPDLTPLPFAPAVPGQAPSIPVMDAARDKPKKKRAGQTMIGTLQSNAPALPFQRSAGPTAPPVIQDVGASATPVGSMQFVEAAVPANVPKPASLIVAASSKPKGQPKKMRFKHMGKAFLAAVDECAQQEGAST